jgi:Domain of unknown function (DUF4157)
VAVPYRREMEAAFGRQFGDVRAHLGRASEMSLLGAEAATRGAEIAFRGSHPSRETVAHELAHTVQRDRGNRGASSGAANLSHPEDPAELEATRAAADVVRGVQPVITREIGQTVARQPASPIPAARPESAEEAPSIPTDLLAEIAVAMQRVQTEGSDAALRRLGVLAVQRLGPEGVVALARQAGVPGAERREREVQEEGETIHRNGAAAAAAASGTAGSMWWLALIDGPLPVGDIVYGALIVGSAVVAGLVIDTAVQSARRATPEAAPRPVAPPTTTVAPPALPSPTTGPAPTTAPIPTTAPTTTAPARPVTVPRVVPRAVPRSQRRGRWTCYGHSAVLQIPSQLPTHVCPLDGQYVDGPSVSGPTEAAACLAAKHAFNAMMPPGCRPKHLACRCSKR